MTQKLLDFTTGLPNANNTVTLLNDSNNTIGQLSTDSNGLFTVTDMLSGTSYYLRFSQGTSYIESYSVNLLATFSANLTVDRSNRPYYMYLRTPLNQLTPGGSAR